MTKPPIRDLDEMIAEIDAFIAKHVDVGRFETSSRECDQILELARIKLSDQPDMISWLIHRMSELGAKLIEDPQTKEWHWTGIRLKDGRAVEPSQTLAPGKLIG